MVTPPPRLVGMVHLLPLPGSPRAVSIRAVHDAAWRDAASLVDAGFTALFVENFGDMPFFPDDVPKATMAAMAAVVARLRESLGPSTFLGVNVLRNDAAAALGVAVAAEANAIRVNVHHGTRVSDQGLLHGRAHETLRMRSGLRAEHVAIWADVRVKHSAPLGVEGPIRSDIEELHQRAGAEAIIVSGRATGSPVDPAYLDDAAAGCRVPLYVGSGATPGDLPRLLGGATGVIVGTALKVGGDVHAPVDLARARAFVAAATAL